MKERSDRLRGLTAGTTLFLLTAGGGSQAAPLDITLLDDSDIASTSIDIKYDADDDLFTAVGIAFEIDDDGDRLTPAVPISPPNGGVFELSATIDAGGSLIGGTLSITGTVLGVGPTLLTANLTDFGFPDAGANPLEFLFEVTGGDLAGQYADTGNNGGIILTQTDFPGSFANDFDNSASSGQGLADTAPVPIPAAL